MNYTYRFLEADDFPNFINMHKGKNSFMNRPITEEEKEKYIARLGWLFFQPDYKVIGCFLGDQLLAVGGCRFFKNKMAGYVHGQCFNLNYNDFNYISLFAEVCLNFIRMFMEYAEQLGIYQIYMARELSEGLTMNRLFKRTVKKHPLFANLRYLYMLDKIYKTGDVEILEPHEFFFKPDNVVKRDTLVSFLILKPELREELLRINQQP